MLLGQVAAPQGIKASLIVFYLPPELSGVEFHLIIESRSFRGMFPSRSIHSEKKHGMPS